MSKSTFRMLAGVAVLPFALAACTYEQHNETEVTVEAEGEQAGSGAMAMAEVTDERDASEGSDEQELPEASGEQELPEASGEQDRPEAGGEHNGREEHGEGGGEHARGGRGDEHGAGEAEESGVRIGRTETWDATRNGARLVLAFDPARNSFVGTVENTTRQTLCEVRVEVHLSTGTELGPTARTNVAAGEVIDVELATAGEAFDAWTAHPEMSACLAT